MLVLCLLLMPLFASRPAAAGKCISPAKPEAASLEKAPIAFVGTVVSTSNHSRVADVRVEEVWKGPVLPEAVEVRGTSLPAEANAIMSLDRSFRPRARYLFVPRDRGATTESSGVPVFDDNVCTATREYLPEFDELRPASVTRPLHVDRPATGDGDTGGVPILALAIILVAGLVVAALVARVRSLRRGGPIQNS